MQKNAITQNQCIRQNVKQRILCFNSSKYFVELHQTITCSAPFSGLVPSAETRVPKREILSGDDFAFILPTPLFAYGIIPFFNTHRLFLFFGPLFIRQCPFYSSGIVIFRFLSLSFFCVGALVSVPARPYVHQDKQDLVKGQINLWKELSQGSQHRSIR